MDEGRRLGVKIMAKKLYAANYFLRELEVEINFYGQKLKVTIDPKTYGNSVIGFMPVGTNKAKLKKIYKHASVREIEIDHDVEPK
jgi:hypothetical protein